MSIKTMVRFSLLLSTMLFFFCTLNPVSKGGTDTGNGIICFSNGAPAPGVTVKVFDVNDTSRIPIAQAVTDNSGHYALNEITKGTYNIWAEKDSLVAVQDSVFISPSSSTIKMDTLHASGSITAIIGMQPNDDPRSTYVQMIGSDRYSRNIDPQGYFTIDGLATGLYNLRVSTTQPNYTPTFFTVPAHSGQADTLKDTLWLIYTGIPIVTGLSAVYDTVTGIMQLSWNKTSFRNFQDYLIFRDPCDSIQPSTLPIKSITDTLFLDTIFNKNKTGQYSFSDSNDYCLKYRVCIRNNSNIQGLTYKYIAVTAASPLYKIPQVKIVSSDTMYCNTPMTIRAAILTKSPTIKKCEWKIGETGHYATTSISQPETTIVIPDTLIPYLRCYTRATNDKGFVANDSMDLHLLIGWEQVINPNNLDPYPPMSEIVYNNQLLLFGSGSTNGIYTNTIWATSDGVAWSKLTNSLPFSQANQLFSINFGNEIWLLSDSTLWHSNNGINWNSAGTIPIKPNCIAFFTDFNNKLYIGDRSTSRGSIWTSTDGLSWSILKSVEDGTPVSIPMLGSDSLTAFDPLSVYYSTVLMNDTLFLSRTYETETIIWKITNWEMPILLTQHLADDNFLAEYGVSVQLVEFMDKLCIFDTPTNSNDHENLFFYDGMAWNFASKPPEHIFPGVFCQHIAFAGKLYQLVFGQGIWVTK